ncbi:MAG: RNA polymerase sigma-70 factor [Sphingobacteriales bacterium]|nr:MAG: RNA polymerase sigma-70 factor [Sphingobacteriales bacterium]
MTSYSSHTDLELLPLLKGGDRAAFTEIYNRYWLVAYRSAMHILRDEDACMDVLQDVFVWLWQHREQQQINSLKPYILTAVKFKMLNVIRQGKIKEFAHSKIKFEEEYQSDTNIEVKELMQMINEFADGLPSQAKQIFQMSRYEHLSNKEIALKMGITEKTVKNQINISLRKLKSNLGRMSFWGVMI